MRALLALAPVALACSPNEPVKTSSGTRIADVTVEERFPTNPDPKVRILEGDALRRAVPLLEKHGILELSGRTFEAKDVVESETVSIATHAVAQPEERVTLKSCKHDRICAFFDDAFAQGLVKHKPVVCGGNATACPRP